MSSPSLTASDLATVTFERTSDGYRVADVDAFLSLAAQALAQLETRVTILTNQVDTLRTQLAATADEPAPGSVETVAPAVVDHGIDAPFDSEDPGAAREDVDPVDRMEPQYTGYGF